MKVVIVARRNEQRIIRWQGVMILVLVYLAAAGPAFFGGYFLLCRAVPDAAGVFAFFLLPMCWWIGFMLVHSMNTPLHKLPLLDGKSPPDEWD